jgi:hypothetical protein
MRHTPSLRLFFERGVCNEYRLRDEVIEFRIDDGPWRVLIESEIELHFRFKTEIAQWLRRHQFRLPATPVSAAG